MLKILITTVLMAIPVHTTWAGELDNDAAIANSGLKGTLVVRVDDQTGEIAYLKSDVASPTLEAATTIVSQGEFQPVPAANLRTELDQDAGASSWYFMCGRPWWGQTYWYGYVYRPYYAWNWGYYHYYYYNPFWRWHW